MRICLITPSHLSANPRLVKEADALVETGHEVTVVAATYQAWSRQADHAFDLRPWRRTPPIPYGPDAPRGRRIIQVALNKVSRALFATGARDERILIAACHPAARDLAASAAKTPADFYVAHNLAALPAAAWAARRHGARYAFDAEDFHPGQFDDGEVSMDQELVKAIEGRWIGGCAWMTAASPGIAEAYVHTYAVERPTVLLNVFPRSEAAMEPTARGTFEPSPSIYWFSQTIGRNRGLETAIRAIAHARSQPHLVLRGQPSSGYAEMLRRLAAEEHVDDRLHILPIASPLEMANLASVHDLGLSGEPGHCENNRIALGNKLFTYLAAGVPVVASDVPAHQGLARQLPDAAFLYRAEEPASLAKVVDALLLDESRLASARAAAFRLGQERFNWDIEKAKLVGLVEGIGQDAPSS